MAEASEVNENPETYEFDAPTHVFDLQKVFLEDEGDDSWFEQANGPLQTPKPASPFNSSDASSEPRTVLSPQVKADFEPEQASGQLQTPKPASPPSSNNAPSEPRTSLSPQAKADVAPVFPNIVTSWGPGAPASTAGQPKKTTRNQPPAQPRRVSKRKGQTCGPTSPPSKKQKSSEDKELERIKNLQKEVALQRKKNMASYKASLAGQHQPVKMALSATVPKEFHFSTNNRVKATTSSNTAQKEVDFTMQLRKPSSPAKAMKGATVPKPFNLSAGNKRKAEPAYVPMAQQIEQFEKRTPDRYHLRSRKSQERGPSPLKSDRLKLTLPHTPNLITRQRSRPPTVKSSAELEAEEVDKLQKFKFKALKLNKKILEEPEHLKKQTVKEPTVPEGFELQIEKRLQERQATKTQEGENETHTFKSQPLPKKILEGVVGLPEKKVLPITVPESPAFLLKKRVHIEPEVVEVKQPPVIKASIVPHFGLPFQPRLPEKHNVEVCPFSFEERERERRALKEKKVEEKRNEEVYQFKAQPLPDFNTVMLPEKKKLEPTKPEPFRLLLDERGAVKNSRTEQMVKEEHKHQAEAALFKARPNVVTHKEPFQPKKELRSSVVAEPFELSTERRARERQEFERLVSEKEALRMLMEEEQRKEEEQKSKEEIARMRQQQVHKAQPIRHYKPVALKKSVHLTIPQSPNFSDRFRL